MGGWPQSGGNQTFSNLFTIMNSFVNVMLLATPVSDTSKEVNSVYVKW